MWGVSGVSGAMAASLVVVVLLLSLINFGSKSASSSKRMEVKPADPVPQINAEQRHRSSGLLARSRLVVLLGA